MAYIASSEHWLSSLGAGGQLVPEALPALTLVRMSPLALQISFRLVQTLTTLTATALASFRSPLQRLVHMQSVYVWLHYGPLKGKPNQLH